MKILLTGGNGYIAKGLYKALQDKYDIHSITRSDFSLANANDVISWFKDKYFDVVIHTAIKGGSRLEEDDARVVDENLTMYYNLLSQESHYSRFINFGSGAETYDTPYGISKKIISDSVRSRDNYFNLRIFAIFDENELDRRFIKSNLIRYVNKEPILLDCDKKMDFFYMEDLVLVVDYYISDRSPPKELDCTYDKKTSLLDVANIINSLSDYKVDIEVGKGSQSDYCGNYAALGLKYIGLNDGINKVFKNLKISYNSHDSIPIQK